MSDGFLNIKNEIKTMQSNVKKQYQVNVLIDKNVTALETALSKIDQDVITMNADIKTLKERSLILLKANQCPELTSIRNGEIFKNTNEGVRNIYGSVAEYRCNIGYSLNGNTSIKVYNRHCQADRTWSGKQPTCDESCILPKHAANYGGQRIVSPGTTLNNFACDSGYVLSSQHGMTCHDGGSWSQIVTCIKGCTLPDHTANHKDRGSIFSPGEILNNFYCGHGYVLSSENGMTCQRGGSWSEIVTCIKGCTLPNHAASSKDGRTTFSPGETLNNFACQPGYVLSSQNGMTCRRGGSWSEIVTCVKVQPKECVFDAGHKWHPRWKKKSRTTCTLLWT
ncbi:CUB and sushi domain-containing protein 3-like isoform X2 [Mercenaria mercenaria]|uniref:CUB and sushi domain-containing protein 3-like isoform X2 n=1 Tax=Mercenaria mercenaria TaxID=6596 RepID=UPI00234E5624|nr:CUB and sushi domain-containing protein 3-like isoform X2 [Mercenaria mercenaria]